MTAKSLDVQTSIRLSKDMYDNIMLCCEMTGETLMSFIRRACATQIEKELPPLVPPSIDKELLKEAIREVLAEMASKP